MAAETHTYKASLKHCPISNSKLSEIKVVPEVVLKR
jgi:hypothetical protein